MTREQLKGLCVRSKCADAEVRVAHSAWAVFPERGMPFRWCDTWRLPSSPDATLRLLRKVEISAEETSLPFWNVTSTRRFFRRPCSEVLSAMG